MKRWRLVPSASTAAAAAAAAAGTASASAGRHLLREEVALGRRQELKSGELVLWVEADASYL